MSEFEDIEIVGIVTEEIEPAEMPQPIAFKHLPGDLVEIEGRVFSGDFFRYMADPEPNDLLRMTKDGDHVVFHRYIGWWPVLDRMLKEKAE